MGTMLQDRNLTAAGSDIIETNTFGSTALVLAEYDIADPALLRVSGNMRSAGFPCLRPLSPF
jgi:methionine synthase I (cobalamin-dependent)